MQRLEVSCVVRLIYRSLGVKGLNITDDLDLTDSDYFSHHEIPSKKKINWLYHYFSPEVTSSKSKGDFILMSKPYVLTQLTL